MPILAPLLILASVNLQSKMEISYPVLALKPTASAEAGALKVIQGLETTWNTHDMVTYADLIADECQWVNVVGMWWQGKDEVVRAHAAFHKSLFKSVNQYNEAASLRQIAPGVVLAVVRVRMESYTTPDGKVIPEGRTRLTYVIVQHGEKWQVASAQNTPIDPVAQQFDPIKH